jgi:glucose/arabinose dehydrogenase
MGLKIFLITLVAALSALGQEGKVYTTNDGVRFSVETVVANLHVPWPIVFDKAGNMYFTERSGRLSILRKGETTVKLLGSIEGVVEQGEGGLMGLALHPRFVENHWIYLSLTYRFKEALANTVVRYTLENGALVARESIVKYLPGSAVHNGCRIKFGPDGKLYVTTGDAADRKIAQDIASLGGKILRVNDDGSVPSDNPDPKSPIFVLGVRNPQGIDWHPENGLMFETEHGPSGFDGPGGGDEVNIIEAGKNYGWPVIHHKDSKDGMISPLLEYTPAIAPGGAAFYSGKAFPAWRNNFFFGGLRGTRIQRVILDEKDPRKVKGEEVLLNGEFGRIREVVEGPNGEIYFSTSNTSRGRPTADDDRILRIVRVN